MRTLAEGRFTVHSTILQGRGEAPLTPLSEDQPTKDPEAARAATDAPPPRRGCLGTAVSGGCGCFAFLFGAALAVALFAPQLLSGYGARVIEKYLGGRIDGTIEVSNVALFWGSQQSADVLVRSTDGLQVLQGSIDFPPLLDLIGSPETEQRYKVTINRLDSTIFADGSSTLGKTFRVDAEDGATLVRRLAERATSELKGIRSRKPEASIKVTVRLNEASIKDVLSGRGTVDIRYSELEIGASAVDAHVKLHRSRVMPEGQPEVDVKFEARFGLRPGGQEELLGALLEAGPLSTATLQTLGILPRTPRAPTPVDRRIERDLFDRVTPGLFDLAEAYLEKGTAVEFRYGRLKPMEATAQRAAVPLTMRLESDAGTFDLRAEIQFPTPEELASGAPSAAIVGAPQAKERDALAFELDAPLEPLVDIVKLLAPTGSSVLAESPVPVEARARWRGRVKSFRVPFDRSCLRVGGNRDDLFGLGSAEPVVAAALRRTECLIDLASIGSNPASVTVTAGDSGSSELRDTLTLRHRFTRFTLLGRIGGKFESQWVTAGVGGGSSFVKGSLPGAPILIGPELEDYPDGKLELQVMGVPKAVLGTFVDFPESFASLLPERFYRVVVRDLPLRFVLGEESRDPTLDLEVWTEQNERLAGRYLAGEFTCPEGQLDVPLGEEAQERVLKRMMPWLESIQPVQGGGQLKLEIEDFVFRLGDGDERESGRMTIDAPPLRVKLDRRLAGQLRLGSSGGSGWIEWDPAPMVIQLDGATTRYEFVELPLGGGDVSAMSGFATMGTYNLSTSLERRFLRHLAESKSGALPQTNVAVLLDNSAGGKPRINVSPSEFTSVLEGIGELLSPEKRKEIWEKFGLTENEE